MNYLQINAEPTETFWVKYSFINYIFALIMCDFICKMCVFEGSETGPIYIAVGGGQGFSDRAKIFRGR